MTVRIEVSVPLFRMRSTISILTLKTLYLLVPLALAFQSLASVVAVKQTLPRWPLLSATSESVSSMRALNLSGNTTYTGELVISWGARQSCICIDSLRSTIIIRFLHFRYAFGIVICSISLVTVLFVLVGVAFGMIGFRKNVDPSERSGLSHCGGIFLLMYVHNTSYGTEYSPTSII